MAKNRKPSRLSIRPVEIEVVKLDDLWRETQPGKWGYSYDAAFRGEEEVVCAETALVPKLMRSGALRRNEQRLLRNFERYGEPYFREPPRTKWGLLALAQHHGLPTRLLDWTFSSLAALHFITCDARKHCTDGVLWRVDLEGVKNTSPPDLKRLLAKEGAIVFTETMLADKFDDLLKLDRFAKGEQGFVVFFEPPSLDERIIHQFALFSVAPKRVRSLRPLLSRKGLLKKIIIPARLKGHVRKYLDRNNITERTLFPGLDGMARFLGRHYAEELRREPQA